MNNLSKKSQRWGVRAVVAVLAVASVGLVGAGVADAKPIGSTPTPSPDVPGGHPPLGTQVDYPVTGQIVESGGRVTIDIDAGGHHFTGRADGVIGDFQSPIVGNLRTFAEQNLFETASSYGYSIRNSEIGIIFKDANGKRVGQIIGTLPDKKDSIGTGRGIPGDGNWS